MKALQLILLGASLGLTANAAPPGPPGPPPPKGPRPPKMERYLVVFNKADANQDGFLSLTEFAATQGPGTPLVEVRARFLPIDVAGAFETVYVLDPVTGEPVLDPLTGEPQIATDPVTGEPVKGAAIPDGLISLEEWTAFSTSKNKPQKSRLSRFELADLDGDGLLTPVEFGYLVSPRVKVANVLRNFDKKDKNDDGFLTEAELKDSTETAS